MDRHLGSAAWILNSVFSIARCAAGAVKSILHWPQEICGVVPLVGQRNERIFQGINAYISRSDI